jgi:hypothetical protein
MVHCTTSDQIARDPFHTGGGVILTFVLTDGGFATRGNLNEDS